MITLSKDVFNHIVEALDVANKQILLELEKAEFSFEFNQVAYLNNELMLNKFARDNLSNADKNGCYTLISDFEKVRL